MTFFFLEREQQQVKPQRNNYAGISGNFKAYTLMQSTLIE